MTVPNVPSPKIHEINQKAYSRAAKQYVYTGERWLAPEASLIFRYASELIGRRILEIGAGSGRLAPVLNHYAKSYCATDVNRQMVRSIRELYPKIDARVADVRNLADLGYRKWDVVVFAFNGLDSVPFEDRQRALSEIQKALVQGGVFIHSTHNLSHARESSYTPPLSVSNLTSAVTYFRRLRNRMTRKAYERYSQEYALVNDKALENSLITTYVAPAFHQAQLGAAGLSIEAVYDLNGIPCTVSDLAPSKWYYLVARK